MQVGDGQSMETPAVGNEAPEEQSATASKKEIGPMDLPEEAYVLQHKPSDLLPDLIDPKVMSRNRHLSKKVAKENSMVSNKSGKSNRSHKSNISERIEETIRCDK
jgi:hypothetical protein